MPSATLTSKGQITIPKKVREHLGIEPGNRVSFNIGSEDVTVEPETVDVRSLRGMLKARRRVSLQAMESAIRRGASGR